MSYVSLRAALEAPPRDGKEGMVVYFPGTGDRVKIKQADYVRLHRIIFGLTKRRLWELAAVCDLSQYPMTTKEIARHLMLDPDEVVGIIEQFPDGDWMQALLWSVPEEFAEWVATTALAIRRRVDDWEASVKKQFVELNVTADRRLEAATAINKFEGDYRGALFALLDGKDIRWNSWRKARPEHETFASRGEDAA